MKYKKTDWLDHIKDVDTDEIIQQGTPISARNLNNMEDGIAKSDNSTRVNRGDITSLAVEVAVLKNASLNNITSNVFFENFNNLDDIKVINGIYDEEQRRLYV